MIKRISVLLVAGLLVVPAAADDVTVTVGDSTQPWLGYMNVFNLPADGGDFQFGSGWGIPDLVATFDDGANTLTLAVNTIGDPDPYWYQGGGGPGAPGNKIMEANLYQEFPAGELAGDTLIFEGVISSNTFTEAHISEIFIKDFAPDYSSFFVATIPVVPGPFSVSLALDAGPDRHVQYGFVTTGVNVWITDAPPFGTAVIETVSEGGDCTESERIKRLTPKTVCKDEVLTVRKTQVKVSVDGGNAGEEICVNIDGTTLTKCKALGADGATKIRLRDKKCRELPPGEYTVNVDWACGASDSGTVIVEDCPNGCPE